MRDPNAACRWNCCRNYHLILYAILVLKMAGYKTYLLGAGSIAFGVIGYLLGYQDGNTAMGFIIGGFGGMFMRHGITNEVNK